MPYTVSVGVPFNTYSPACTVNVCLQQVVGSVDGNPLAQASACASMFGSPAPVVSIVTPSVDVVFSTLTTTLGYTDIVVTPSTTTSIVQETVTSYAQVIDTITLIASTRTATVTAQVTAPANTYLKKRGHKKRGTACKAKTSSTSLPALPSSSSSSSSTPVVTSTSSAPLFPLASNCPSLDEYSSACACIAVPSTSTTTLPASVSTSTVYETTSSAIASTRRPPSSPSSSPTRLSPPQHRRCSPR
ncbi:hypothetical protein B0T22DRAFT_168344 [Podospora appendiculata]|uniref:Uncharacterized protein n=1 Tax=Podospora appendiculata TaxID=314037 RepID=A0AAE0XB37_9PEZI|nr:hypothetical protein B0T22DRAFT_168344 [Podospora appendiculata]